LYSITSIGANINNSFLLPALVQISIEKSIQQEKDTTDTTKTERRQSTHKINPITPLPIKRY
jgi:hypothetical protein